MTIDEQLNRHAEYHGRPSTEEEKHALIQSMHDDLNGIYPLPKLKREVVCKRPFRFGMAFADEQRMESMRGPHCSPWWFLTGVATAATYVAWFF